MSSPFVLLLAFLIGFFSGLRALTPATMTAWAAQIEWLRLPRALAWFGTMPAAIIFTVLALAELVNDKNPKAGNRTAPPALTARIVTGGFSGACVAAAGAQGMLIGALIGAAGAIAGTFGGYQARAKLVKALGVPDFIVAVAEDLVTICGSLWVVSRF